MHRRSRPFAFLGVSPAAQADEPRFSLRWRDAVVAPIRGGGLRRARRRVVHARPCPSEPAALRPRRIVRRSHRCRRRCVDHVRRRRESRGTARGDPSFGHVRSERSDPPEGCGCGAHGEWPCARGRGLRDVRDAPARAGSRASPPLCPRPGLLCSPARGGHAGRNRHLQGALQADHAHREAAGRRMFGERVPVGDGPVTVRTTGSCGVAGLTFVSARPEGDPMPSAPSALHGATRAPLPPRSSRSAS